MPAISIALILYCDVAKDKAIITMECNYLDWYPHHFPSRSSSIGLLVSTGDLCHYTMTQSSLLNSTGERDY